MIIGVPEARADDAGRALTAVLDMMEEVRAFSADGNPTLPLHLGVSTGMVAIGSVGARERARRRAPAG